MRTTGLRSIAGALFASLILPWPSLAHGAPPVLLQVSSPEDFAALGMPLSAKRELLSSPPGERGKSPLLPRLLQQLSAAGYGEEAISLFSDSAPFLTEPVRSEAFLAAGKIRWHRKEYREAERAFREVSGKSAAGPEAAYYLGRILASGGKTREARLALGSAVPGPKTALVTGDLEISRGNTAEALAAWRAGADGTAAGFPARIRTLIHSADPSAAARDLRAISLAADDGTPEQFLSRKSLVRVLLRTGDRKAALEAARDGLSGVDRWRNRVLALPEWDGTSAGARESGEAMSALFPYGTETGDFFRATAKFLALADLADTLRASENGARRVLLRIRGTERALALLREKIAGGIRRAEEIRRLFLDHQRSALGMPDRLRNAADTLVLSRWGMDVAPKEGALLDAIGKAQADLQERILLLSTVFQAKIINDWSPPLTPKDRLMVLSAQIRLSRLKDSLRSLEGRTAILRGTVWNRWKAKYAARLSRLFDDVDDALATAADGAAKAEYALAALRAAHARQEPWPDYLRWMTARLADHLDVLAKRRGKVGLAADGALHDARRALLEAVEQNGRDMRYLAARAATEWLIEGREFPAGHALSSGEDRMALLREAAALWEAVTSSRIERREILGEALYALAELRTEEADVLFFKEGEDPGRRKDYSVPISLFRRVIEEFPDSPYAEPALYGLAVCHEEEGAADDAIAAMAALLSRYPRTRFSDEVFLRLGEFAFDRRDFHRAGEYYGNVRETATPELLTTARFKLGWSLVLRERPSDAAEAFLSALLLSPEARKTGGMHEESAKMLARSLVEAGRDADTERFLARRGAASHGPAVLLQVQSFLEMLNRYEEAAGIADRFASAYPLAAERVTAELAAAEALRKGDRVKESHARRRRFHEMFGPGSAWQAAPGRSAGDIARADVVSMEGLHTAAFYSHAKIREAGGGDRTPVLASYDTYLALFPTSPRTEEVAYQRAWLLFEAGRKMEAKTAFETVGRNTDGARGEPSWYMAVQCAKDSAPESDPAGEAEVVRLAREYERAFPKGERFAGILIDRGRAHFNRREFAESAEAARKAGLVLPPGPERRKARRLEGDAKFQMSDFAGSEAAFREILAESPEPEERRDVEKWIAFSLFRRAEVLPPERAADAAVLFARAAREFPAHEIAQTALYRAGTASVEAGNTAGAIAAFLAVEAAGKDRMLATESTRWLARLYENAGDRGEAGERYERLAAGEESGSKKGTLMLRAAELFAGTDETRSRRNFAAVASLAETPEDLRAWSLFRAAESARTEGKIDEADRYYEETVNAQRAAPTVPPEIAGKALFQRAEIRFARYRSLPIVLPLEKTFPAKQSALEDSLKLYVEAVRVGDADTVSASLHRLGEGFEDFRTAILASPPPPRLSRREREEYAFLLEEKAAPIEDKAVESYRNNLRQAVAANFFSPWVKKSRERLQALRPALFDRKGEFAFPVVTVPEFVGIIERRMR